MPRPFATLAGRQALVVALATTTACGLAAAESTAAEPTPTRGDPPPTVLDAFSGVDFGIVPGGGGAFIQSEHLRLRLLGYAQFVASAFDGSLDRADEHGDFSMRRARVDFLLDAYEDYQLLIELDGASDGTALIEARFNWKILDERLQLRAGKFTSPFSAENFRSSRAIDTVERFIALNSLFLLPALDTQFGAMLHGQASPQWGYYLGVFNGNGKASANLSDDNGEKEVVAKLTWAPSDELDLGLAVDISHEEEQELALADLGFTRYVGVDIAGTRVGIGGDLHYRAGPLDVRAEGLWFQFEDLAGEDVDLIGGFVQAAWWFRGDSSGGLQGLLRAETAAIDAEEIDASDQGDTLSALTLGLNWFPNGNTRFQLNAIAQHFDGASQRLGFDDDDRIVPMALAEWQIKF